MAEERRKYFILNIFSTDEIMKKHGNILQLIEFIPQSVVNCNREVSSGYITHAKYLGDNKDKIIHLYGILLGKPN